MVKINKDQKQLDLFEENKPWKKNGFATREEWQKAKEWDRACIHFQQTHGVRRKRMVKPIAKLRIKPNFIQSLLNVVRGKK